ncbi:Oidioi.mRNA.OKI2018_I69.chrUn_4.g17237.t1.cds [Oikopleura dioica]|uniref:Oidioi.mRNA.OKI2018_I69.chrUn_4.g17237.t1.c ds n=1 Tax=Oikopleura dioica TaxID=34765 RepID=A0ABN7TCI8_OIKDI|nr:Oidioi.mRNA.OKI2018_I69.chrUn_4.g17237.t1.cds [Oikopleura dioica]
MAEQKIATRLVRLYVPSDANEPLSNHRLMFDLQTPSKARFNFAELSSWAQIIFTAPSGKESLWVAHRSNEPGFILSIIADEIAEAETDLADSWQLESKPYPFKPMESPRSF